MQSPEKDHDKNNVVLVLRNNSIPKEEIIIVKKMHFTQ